MGAVVEVRGLQKFRSHLRATDRDALKEVQGITKMAAELVAVTARTRAPRGTRPIPDNRKPHVRLTGSIKATTSGSAGIVRSALPYAKVQEYGGTIAPRGHTITIEPTHYVTSALHDRSAEVGRLLTVGFAAVAKRNGW